MKNQHFMKKEFKKMDFLCEKRVVFYHFLKYKRSNIVEKSIN